MGAMRGQAAVEERLHDPPARKAVRKLMREPEGAMVPTVLPPAAPSRSDRTPALPPSGSHSRHSRSNSSRASSPSLCSPLRRPPPESVPYSQSQQQQPQQQQQLLRHHQHRHSDAGAPHKDFKLYDSADEYEASSCMYNRGSGGSSSGSATTEWVMGFPSPGSAALSPFSSAAPSPGSAAFSSGPATPHTPDSRICPSPANHSSRAERDGQAAERGLYEDGEGKEDEDEDGGSVIVAPSPKGSEDGAEYYPQYLEEGAGYDGGVIEAELVGDEYGGHAGAEVPRMGPRVHSVPSHKATAQMGQSEVAEEEEDDCLEGVLLAEEVVSEPKTPAAHRARSGKAAWGSTESVVEASRLGRGGGGGGGGRDGDRASRTAPEEKPRRHAGPARPEVRPGGHRQVSFCEVVEVQPIASGKGESKKKGGPVPTAAPSPSPLPPPPSRPAAEAEFDDLYGGSDHIPPVDPSEILPLPPDPPRGPAPASVLAGAPRPIPHQPPRSDAPHQPVALSPEQHHQIGLPVPGGYSRGLPSPAPAPAAPASAAAASRKGAAAPASGTRRSSSTHAIRAAAAAAVASTSRSPCPQAGAPPFFPRSATEPSKRPQDPSFMHQRQQQQPQMQQQQELQQHHEWIGVVPYAEYQTPPSRAAAVVAAAAAVAHSRRHKGSQSADVIEAIMEPPRYGSPSRHFSDASSTMSGISVSSSHSSSSSRSSHMFPALHGAAPPAAHAAGPAMAPGEAKASRISSRRESPLNRMSAAAEQIPAVAQKGSGGATPAPQASEARASRSSSFSTERQGRGAAVPASLLKSATSRSSSSSSSKSGTAASSKADAAFPRSFSQQRKGVTAESAKSAKGLSKVSTAVQRIYVS